MPFREGDIVLRRPKSGGKVIWLGERLIKEVCELSESYAWKSRAKYKSSVQPCYRNRSVLPDTGKAWRWARINGGFYYYLARIPNRKPTYYRERFGDAAELVRKYRAALAAEDRAVFAAEFDAYIREYHKAFFPCYQGTTEDRVVALSKAAAAVEFGVRQLHENEGLKAPELGRMLAEQVERAGLLYLPKHPRNLQKKVEAVVEGGQAVEEVVYLPRAGNSSALKYDDPQVVAWVVQMRAAGENYSNAHIIRKVQAVCRITGKPVPSDRWFGMAILETNKVKWLTATGRHGSGSRRAQLYEGYVPVQGALYAGDCWQMDATRMNLESHESPDGKRRFLFIVVVRDVHSGDLLGYIFDYAENRWMYRNALKMAVDNSGYLPYELVIDRFPGHNTPEMEDIFHRMAHMGVKVTKTHKPTGKSHVERCFGTLQSVFMMEHPMYYGEGIKSTRENAHRSTDYRKQTRKENKGHWDLTAAYQACVDIVEDYRNTKLSEYSRKHKDVEQSPRELHRWSEKPHVHEATAEQAMMLLGMHKEVTIRNNGRITTEINKVEYIYSVADYGVVAEHQKVVLAYDPEDLSQVELYRREGRLLAHLCGAKAFERPQIYGPQAEHGKVAAEQRRLKEIAERKVQDLEALTSAAGDEADLLQGKYTIKRKAEDAESRLVEEELLRNAVGSPYGGNPPGLRVVKNGDDDELDIVDFVDGNY